MRVRGIQVSSMAGPSCRRLATGLFSAAVLAPAAHGQENPVSQLDLPQIVVIGTTPLPGIGLPPEQFRSLGAPRGIWLIASYSMP
jgi:hypothetical protein